MKQVILILLLSPLLFAACISEATSKSEIVKVTNQYRFDVTGYEFKQPHELKGMNGTNPDDIEISVNCEYITLGGVPWIPAYGEFHPVRYPAEYWEQAILKLKSMGFYGISSCFFWIHHEEIEGEFDFEGRRNLRKYFELCNKHDMAVFARIGPWTNGECRNGGHPDWLVKRLGDPEKPFAKAGGGGKLRKNNPEYVSSVRKYYYQLSKQMEGMYYKDGGPIFAIQLDNEYTPYHSGVDNIELITKEKEMAREFGMIVPIYTTTGWDGALYNQDETIPTYGSYADYFWGPAKGYYRTPSFSFSTQRAISEINTSVDPTKSKETHNFEKYENNPYICSETGMGIDVAYHRRPKVDYKANAAISLVELGSGGVSMGYYMTHGGSNPVGKLSYMSRDLTMGSNDNSVFSYDFQTSIGEFGQIRPSYYDYLPQNHFMADFGKYLAPCRTFIPEEIDELLGKDIFDSKKLQRALRTDGEKAFLFVNNYAMHDTLYSFENVQFSIALNSGTYTIPEKAITIPKGSYFYWPLNLNLEGIKLKYATCQPVLFLEEHSTYVFFQNEGIEAGFTFDNENIASITASTSEIKEDGSITKVVVKEVGLNSTIDITLNSHESFKILILREQQAKQLYRNNGTLYLSDAEVILFNHEELELISENIENSVWMYPISTLDALSITKDGVFEKAMVRFTETKVPFIYETIQDGKDIKYTNPQYIEGATEGIGLNVGVPNDSVFDKGTIVNFDFPEGIPTNLYDVRVVVDYEASALRFYKDGVFSYDNYYNGRPWTLSASHLLKDYQQTTKLALKLIPLQPNDPIYVGGEYWPDLQKSENTLSVNSMKVIPVYKKIINLK